MSGLACAEQVAACLGLVEPVLQPGQLAITASAAGLLDETGSGKSMQICQLFAEAGLEAGGLHPAQLYGSHFRHTLLMLALESVVHNLGNFHFVQRVRADMTG